jgi:hypothetical protein
LVREPFDYGEFHLLLGIHIEKRLQRPPRGSFLGKLGCSHNKTTPARFLPTQDYGAKLDLTLNSEALGYTVPVGRNVKDEQ